MRISREHMFMMMARTVSLRSTCHRLNVGAILVQDNNIISMGYNGSEPGAAHCNEVDCNLKTPGCKRTIHAEDNALSRAKIDDEKELDLYVTHSPCQGCSELIVDKKVNRVFFEVPYRNTAPVNYLIKQGVEVFQIVPSGHILRQERYDG